jgi:signal peptidase
VCRGIASGVTLLAFGVVAVAWFTLARPANLGGPATYLVVRGTSMLPTYATGDLIILRSQPVYRVGEIIGYRVPKGQLGAGLLVIHRIIGGDPAQGFVVKGDNNPAPDPWRPRPSEIAGTPWVMVPGVGQAIAAFRSPALLAGLSAAIVVTIVLMRSPTSRRRQVGVRREPASS